MQRVEDANKHVEQLNALYLSTIETLAMAIDAKDQVTHGHIRRVQSYATQLARQIGIRDEHLLRAIEAAALLHDMGKLAIPEHILNKPGKLTPAEFDKMKLHASVGAEILSAIDFPYPVVPIVRHHHENWDGTGYPDGLRGTDVPIGARILSVVDCFDALTSDRPYRPRLSDEDALKILVERRGSMYDPLVVDTFVRVYQSIAPPSKGQPPASPIQVAAVAQAGPQLTKEADRSTLTADADQMLTLYDLARALAGNVRFIDAADLIAKHLKRLIPYSLCVFYLKDHNADELEARHAVGEGSSFVIGTKMLVGQRLSGWVAANHETICNSESALDLENANQLGLRSCLASPLVFGDRLIGVLTLHSQQSDGFSNDHRRILQLMTRTLADTFRRATDLDTTCGKDPLTGLPSLSHLEHLVSTLMTNVAPAQLRYSLVWIEVQDFDDMSERFGTKIAEAVLIQIAGRVRMSMRGSDLLFRTRVAEFVGFLSETDARVASLVASRVSELVREHTFEGLPEALAVQVQTQYLSAPADGTALSDLLDKLRSNAHMTITLDGVAVR